MPDIPDELPERQIMEEGAARLVDGVERLGAAWVVAAVTRIVDAWADANGDGVDPSTRAHTLSAAQTAGEVAADRVAAELRAFFATDPAAQRVTPLEIIRSLRQEATAVLRAAGIPEVARDEFETRSFPDDVYGIVLKSPGELGDDDLGGALLAWGMGKATTLRKRTKDGPGP